jgi:hypothetical protein
LSRLAEAGLYALTLAQKPVIICRYTIFTENHQLPCLLSCGKDNCRFYLQNYAYHKPARPAWTNQISLQIKVSSLGARL